MSLNSIIKTAVEPIVSVCVPDVYTGAATEYCTFNYSTFPASFGDNKATSVGYSVQLHWFAPLGTNPLAKIALLSNALETAGLSYPNVVNATDEDGNHYVFETTWFEVI